MSWWRSLFRSVHSKQIESTSPSMLGQLHRVCDWHMSLSSFYLLLPVAIVELDRIIRDDMQSVSPQFCSYHHLQNSQKIWQLKPSCILGAIRVLSQCACIGYQPCMRPGLYVMSDTKISELLAAFIYSNNYNEVGSYERQKSVCLGLCLSVLTCLTSNDPLSSLNYQRFILEGTQG